MEPPATSRNLNTTWRDIIFKAYQQDHDADVPFPVRYLLHNPTWKRDLFYTVPKKIEPAAFKKAIFAFHKATKGSENPEYADENISVRPRKPVKATEDPHPQDYSVPDEEVAGEEETGAPELIITGLASG